MNEKLIELRGNRSQEEVAKALGISVSALSMYEQGNRIPRDEIKIRMAKYYGISIDALFLILSLTKREEPST
jgi:transcriptional regulator with XRE-family HTH domain